MVLSYIQLTQAVLLTSADDTLHILMVISTWKLISKKEEGVLSSLTNKMASCMDCFILSIKLLLQCPFRGPF